MSLDSSTSRPRVVLCAVNMKLGTLDSLDLLLWGQVRPDMWMAERKRIDGLCAWGKEWGVDAFVRMEMDFEVMLCDFHSGIQLVSADYLATVWPSRMPPRELVLPPPPSLPEHLRRILEIQHLETVRGGSWHNRYPGDTRIAMDLTKLVSFYDTQLAPSLIPHRVLTERWDHRLQNISTKDAEAVTARLHAVLSDEESESSGYLPRFASCYRYEITYALNTPTRDLTSPIPRLTPLILSISPRQSIVSTRPLAAVMLVTFRPRKKPVVVLRV
ncbi:hypothetical protein FB45DRAFT_1063751 [Roridomyces roridus]|uniref:Uncharacterized protein n=1 Tax=Roridomyces roridus TaxID=1738132 RepID=A0AAD7FFH3_9AGAR|nr:hypothetical protein FB45DRAFT_1063751 [Roridomyces roridus]